MTTADGRDWSDMMYGQASPLERALVEAEMTALAAWPSHLITENLDPEKVQSRNLQALAYGMGVTLWEDIWSEGTKRQWLLGEWNWKSRVGTLPAYDMALAASGYEIVDEVRPPAGCFAVPSLSIEEVNSWIRQMPQIRIKFEEKTRPAEAGAFFADDGFADDGFVGPDFGREILGRVAVIRYADGTEKPLQIFERMVSTSTLDFVDVEDLAIPYDSPFQTFADADFADDMYAAPDLAAGQTIAIRRDASYARVAVETSMTTVQPGLKPISPFYEVDSDTGSDAASPHATFADDAVGDVDYVLPDPAASLLADRVYLNDPSVAVPMVAGVSFADYSRVSLPSEYLELIIDTHTKMPPDASTENDGYADVSFAMPTDESDMDRAIRAVVASKALRDTVLVSFEARRLVTASDNLTEAATAVDWINNHL